jgi:hypothetical protein
MKRIFFLIALLHQLTPPADAGGRAAIREVAAWLRSQDLIRPPLRAQLRTGDYWAGRLEQEADRD